ncbi:hypothetical protein PHYSODRAFT_358115 [Phytophthora sojae]|uniref:WRKY19-like zinc finger domain-containing protein n=1 Tax=Phytophthora sojae (strain P6497) TaxID=1094619 RepID=G5AC14_PHYSP|nr:hypothetical protein PHYSODRAFT_356086 [Phytophthora sojae]XP_009537674.1 hypothetical protein PHYSODRAFT_356089 [Phytophthora sojae]XP_009540119.1 hypothetical protein PHYSODRAFT_358115 [Phytophthora sojae]EGZ04438.1 hypothetical protein PHYSODRAFT_358115 [Phytophthora sojae]EGZ06889.1 hypothetical protein PHYSODRAFT_356086 [Phytophthora sojae]EGZ06910.1 hypothetical protein PHYSODRAFT_356089 [Phytophthora sojae]|eukprot:XP_009537653.1 hypothetical protein PHYSODRAFT_356086 [Phytophthora sojae]
MELSDFDRALQPPDALEPEPATPPPDEHKFALPFILNVPAAAASVGAISSSGSATQLSKEEKKRRRTCKHEGCRNYIVHKGLCCRHGVSLCLSLCLCLRVGLLSQPRGVRPGAVDAMVTLTRTLVTGPSVHCGSQGGKKCTLEGCSTSAKHRGLCWKHGGSVKCKEVGCDKKAKARGLCWAHGGGTKCRNTGCAKVAVSNGFCWAHGGGKRCEVKNCIKPAYERTHNLCEKHFVQLRHANYYEL